MPSLISGTVLKCPINSAAQRMAKVICIMDQLVQTILSLSMKPFWPDKNNSKRLKDTKSAVSV